MLTESVKKVYVCRLTCCQACRSVCPVSQKLPGEIFHYGEYGEITLVLPATFLLVLDRWGFFLPTVTRLCSKTAFLVWH